MRILIFDTETTSLEKPFCYNIGYVIYDTDTKQALLKKDFVCEQVWHNLPLFSTAYYNEKRPLYIASMRARKSTLEKFGRICQELKRDIKSYNVHSAYAFNSPFDTKVFDYNCDWFKCVNPFDNIPIYDIRGYAIEFIANAPGYKAFCERHEYFTDSGNYSTTAENIARYVKQEFIIEEHTALSDSELELEILQECFMCGAQVGVEYKVPKSLKRNIEKTLVIEKDKQELFKIKCNDYRVIKTQNKIVVK